MECWALEKWTIFFLTIERSFYNIALWKETHRAKSRKTNWQFSRGYHCMPSYREMFDLLIAGSKGDKNMRSRAPNSSRLIWRPRATAYGTYSQQSLLKRFRYFIESTNWEEKLLSRGKWFDKLCVGCIIISVLYFIPVLVLSILK